MKKRNLFFPSLLLALMLLLTCLPPAMATEGASTEEMTPTQILNVWYQLSDILRANGKYPFTQLRPGNKGYEVTCLQSRLQDLGYYRKSIDSVYGSGTEAGMRAFERAHGLPVNGIASETDQQLLYSDSAQYNPGYSLTPKKPATTPKKPAATPKPGILNPGLQTTAPGHIKLPKITPKMNYDPYLPIATPKPVHINIPGGIIDYVNSLPTATPKVVLPNIPNIPKILLP